MLSSTGPSGTGGQRGLRALWTTVVEASIDDVWLHGATVVGFTEDASTPSWEAGQRQAALVTGYLQRTQAGWDRTEDSAVVVRLPNGTGVECQAAVVETPEPALGANWTRRVGKSAGADALRVANVLRRAGR
jgi:hypothetical protein